MDTNNNKKVWWAVGIIIIAAIGTWMFMRSQSVTPVTEVPTVSSITVSDQDANTIGVTIDSVTLNVSGFIGIYEDSESIPGVGRIVGYSKLLAGGTHNGESIIMTTFPGRYYLVFLYADDGNGIFEAAKDLPIKNAASDQPVMARFQVKPAGTGIPKG